MERFSPSLVGITCPFTLMDEEMRRVASIVKSVDPNIRVVAGGAHPSSMPEYVICDPNIDFVVVGEGEKTFIELIQAIDQIMGLSDVKGLWWKINGKIIENEKREFIKDLDGLPFPAWRLLPVEDYIKIGQVHGGRKRKRYLPMTTSRGCPGRCVFCSIHSVWGHAWRARSPENVVDEIEEMISVHKVEEIHFEDDNLTLSKSRMEKICDLITGRGLDITWTTPNGVAVNTLDEDLLDKMKRSGCYQLNFGIESGDPYVLRKIIGKPLNFDKIQKVVNYSKKIGIWTHGFFVIGFPGETRQNISRTISFAKNVDLDSANFFIATPYPKTPLYSLASSKGLIKNDLEPMKLRTMYASMHTEYFEDKELLDLQRRLYFEFIKHRIKIEILHGYCIGRLFKLKSRDDLSFILQKISRVMRIVK